MKQISDVRYKTMKTISYGEIKEKLVRHHNPDELPENRGLMVTHAGVEPDAGDVIFFMLPGSPPDGYGIFVKGRKLLVLYTTRCRPFEEIEVDEVVSGYGEGGEKA